MPERSDIPPTLTEAQICEINGVSQQYRKTLVRRKIVRPAQPNGCTVRDALELAAIIALKQALAPSDVVLALPQLAEHLGASLPGGRLDAVYDRQHKRLLVARDDASLRAMLLHGRPVSVIPLAERLADVADACRRIASVHAPTKERVARRDARAA
jgi:hypothetical protein